MLNVFFRFGTIKKLLPFVLLIISPNIYLSQIVKVSKIHDSNLFELTDGRLIKLAGVDIPNITSTNPNNLVVAKQAKRFAEKILLNRKFSFISIENKVKTSIYSLGVLSREFPTETVLYNLQFLEKGFGKFINNLDTLDSKLYRLAEHHSKRNEFGIWEYSDNYDVDTLDSFLSRQPIVLYLEKLTTIEPEEKIIRIIDSNLFELADGRLIKLANVDVPNIIYEDSLLQQVGINAYKYAKQNLLDNNFDFTYLTNNSLDTNYTLVSIISNFVLSDRDFIEEFLEKGFGKYISNCSDTDTNKYLLAEEEPKQNMDGIWEYKRNYNYLLDQTIANFNSNFL